MRGYYGGGNGMRREIAVLAHVRRGTMVLCYTGYSRASSASTPPISLLFSRFRVDLEEQRVLERFGCIPVRPQLLPNCGSFSVDILATEMLC